MAQSLNSGPVEFEAGALSGGNTLRHLNKQTLLCPSAALLESKTSLHLAECGMVALSACFPLPEGRHTEYAPKPITAMIRNWRERVWISAANIVTRLGQLKLLLHDVPSSGVAKNGVASN